MSCHVHNDGRIAAEGDVAAAHVTALRMFGAVVGQQRSQRPETRLLLPLFGRMRADRRERGRTLLAAEIIESGKQILVNLFST